MKGAPGRNGSGPPGILEGARAVANADSRERVGVLFFSDLGAVTKLPIHLFLFRYGSLCRFGMSPLNLFFDNGLPHRVTSPSVLRVELSGGLS